MFDSQGAMFIGTSIAGVLFGVSCVQAYFYAMNYKGDPLHMKVLVSAVFICDLLHQIFISHSGMLPQQRSYAPFWLISFDSLHQRHYKLLQPYGSICDALVAYR
jgi:hypothetical protein